ncbi:MAG TPA: hypothetical protein DCM87_18915 [Planctomycetes bacterium]|nr:hypothetical protein [Planctomycetota bacterium]
MLAVASWSWAGHTVLVEGVSMTTCPACAAASAAINSIVSSGTYDICYIAYIYDRNSGSSGRINELQVSFVPDYFFDGGYESWIGSGSLPNAYTDRITACLDRAVPDLALTVRAVWEAQAYIGLTASIANRGDTDYRGRLRVCIAERESRWLTTAGEPFHHAMIGPFALNQDILVPAGGTREFTGAWDGLLAGFSAVTQENLVGAAFVTANASGHADAAAEAAVVSAGGDQEFLRGDGNADGKLDIADAIFTLSYLFAKGKAPTCLDAADANDEGKIDIADAIAVLGRLFAGTGPLPAPFGACGADPTTDGLNCALFPPCAP